MEALILPALLFGIFYFLLIRPQQRKLKEQQALIKKAGEGDRVMLTSGIYGTISEVVGTAVYLEVAEGIELLVNKSFIQDLLDEFPTESEPQDTVEDMDVDDVDDEDMDDEDFEDADENEVDA